MNERVPKNGGKEISIDAEYDEPQNLIEYTAEPTIEHSIDLEKENVEVEKEAEEIPEEDTPKGWRNKLKGLIMGAEGALKNNVEEAKELFVQEKAYLTSRSKELGEKAKNFDPKIEQTFRSMGEKYNKLSTREKIGIGIALGLGAGGLAAVSVPAAFVFFGGIAAQRIAGLASSFLKYEKSSKSKEAAMGKAMFRTAAMTAGMLALAEGVKEGTEWLSHHWPSGDSVLSAKIIPAEDRPEIQHPAAAAAAGESAASQIPALETQSISVEASPGHGYEWMMKRTWEQLQDKGVDASKFGEDTDIHKLLDATQGTIDKVVHQIASDPQHGFFNADGTSVQINPSDHISIGSDGQIHLNGEIHAPEGAPVTPEYHPDTNHFGIAIPSGEPNFYSDAGAKHIFAYGGSPAERADAILKYLTNHPNKIVYGTDYTGTYRIPWYLVEGKAISGAPVHVGFWRSLFSGNSFMKAPGPEEFEKIIK